MLLKGLPTQILSLLFLLWAPLHLSAQDTKSFSRHAADVVQAARKEDAVRVGGHAALATHYFAMSAMGEELAKVMQQWWDRMSGARQLLTRLLSAIQQLPRCVITFSGYSEHVDCLEELVAAAQGIEAILDAIKISSRNGDPLSNREARVMCTVEEHLQKSALLTHAAESTVHALKNADETASSSVRKVAGSVGTLVDRSANEKQGKERRGSRGVQKVITITLKKAARPAGMACKHLGKFTGKKLSSRHGLSQGSRLAGHIGSFNQAAHKGDAPAVAGHAAAAVHAFGQTDWGYESLVVLREQWDALTWVRECLEQILQVLKGIPPFLIDLLGVEESTKCLEETAQALRAIDEILAFKDKIAAAAEHEGSSSQREDKISGFAAEKVWQTPLLSDATGALGHTARATGEALPAHAKAAMYAGGKFAEGVYAGQKSRKEKKTQHAPPTFYEGEAFYDVAEYKPAEEE